MMIGLISDTHDNVPGILKAVNIFRDKKVELVIHLGDIVAPATVKYFKGLNIRFIQGNCDGDIGLIKKRAEEINGKFLGKKSELILKGKKILLLHGNFGLDKSIKSHKYDYVIHGHFHEKKDEKIGKTRVINPGTLYLGNEEHTIAFLDLDKDKLEFEAL